MAARFTMPARTRGAAAGARSGAGPGPGLHGPYAAGSRIPDAGHRPRGAQPNQLPSANPRHVTALEVPPPLPLRHRPTSLGLIAIGP